MALFFGLLDAENMLRASKSAFAFRHFYMYILLLPGDATFNANKRLSIHHTSLVSVLVVYSLPVDFPTKKSTAK